MDIHFKKITFDKYSIINQNDNLIVLCYGKPKITKNFCCSSIEITNYLKKLGEKICEYIIKYREEVGLYNKNFISLNFESNTEKAKAIIKYFDNLTSYSITKSNIYIAVFYSAQNNKEIQGKYNNLLTPIEIKNIFREKYLDLIFMKKNSLPTINDFRVTNSFKQIKEILEYYADSLDLIPAFSYLYKNPIVINNSSKELTDNLLKNILEVFNNYCKLYGLPYYYSNIQKRESFLFKIKEEFTDIPMDIETSEDSSNIKCLKYDDYELISINNFLFTAVLIYLLCELNYNKNLYYDDKIKTKLKYISLSLTKGNIKEINEQKLPYYINDIFEFFNINIYLDENTSGLINIANTINEHMQKHTNNFFGIEFDNIVFKKLVNNGGTKKEVTNLNTFDNVILGVWNDFFNNFLIYDELLKENKKCFYGHTKTSKWHKTKDGKTLCHMCYNEKRKEDIRKNVSKLRSRSL